MSPRRWEHSQAQCPAGHPQASTKPTKCATALKSTWARYLGLTQGVLNAIRNVNDIIAPKLIAANICVTAQREIDTFLIKLDGTANKSQLGANAILGVSLAVARAGAAKKVAIIALSGRVSYMC